MRYDLKVDTYSAERVLMTAWRHLIGEAQGRERHKLQGMLGELEYSCYRLKLNSGQNYFNLV